MTTFNSSSDVIDSRDIIDRIEELEGTLQAAHEEALADASTNLDFEEWVEAVYADAGPAHCHEYHGEAEEYRELKALEGQAESSPDWQYGESLINEDYFTDYIEELIKDCYEMPKDMNSGNWPWRHMVMDYESAAEEAKVDYMEVSFWGNTFLIRA